MCPRTTLVIFASRLYLCRHAKWSILAKPAFGKRGWFASRERRQSYVWLNTATARPGTSRRFALLGGPYRTSISSRIETPRMAILTAPPRSSRHRAAYHCRTCRSRMLSGTPLNDRCFSLAMKYCSSESHERRPMGPWTIDRGSNILAVSISAGIVITRRTGSGSPDSPRSRPSAPPYASPAPFGLPRGSCSPFSSAARKSDPWAELTQTSSCRCRSRKQVTGVDVEDVACAVQRRSARCKGCARYRRCDAMREVMSPALLYTITKVGGRDR